MTDVAIAIDAEAVAVTFYPPPAATYDERGNAVFGAAPAPLAGAAAIQPVSGRVLMDLPEGIRLEVSLVGWARTMVAPQWEILYGGEKYRVVHIWPRPMDGFTKFALKRVG